MSPTPTRQSFSLGFIVGVAVCASVAILLKVVPSESAPAPSHVDTGVSDTASTDTREQLLEAYKHVTAKPIGNRGYEEKKLAIDLMQELNLECIVHASENQDFCGRFLHALQANNDREKRIRRQAMISAAQVNDR